MSMIWTIVAVVAAGVGGTIANSIVVAALTPNPFLELATSPGRNAVAVMVAALLPVIDRLMSGAGAAAIAIVLLTVIPTVLAKTVFGIAAPWSLGLAVNAVYALAAWAIYRAIERGVAPSSSSPA